MIFTKFFKAKWQHKDDSVRLVAVIEDLDTTSSDDHKILVSLALSDPSVDVQLAAFKKLNQPGYYWQALNLNQPALVELAIKSLERTFVQDLPSLNPKQKALFLTHCKKTSLLETWYKEENNTELQRLLFNQLNKPSFLYSAFVYAKSEVLQNEIIAGIDEQQLLEKCLKKSTDKSISESIQAKLTLIESEVNKPLILKKDTQLTLSMLLALKEQSDYEQVLVKREALDKKWLALVSEFDCLTQEEQQVFEDKYQYICEQLTKAFVVKAEAYQQALVEKKLKEQKLAEQVHIEEALKNIAQVISNAIFETNAINETTLNQAFTQLSEFIETSIIPSSDKKRFNEQIESERAKLNSLPEIAKSVSDATHLVARIAQLSLPTTLEEYRERSPIFNEWKNDWLQVEKHSAGVLPESLNKAHQEITQSWQSALAPFAKAQAQSLKQTFNKFADVKRLIRQGKYNASFGVFKSASKLYNELSADLKIKAQKDFESISEKIAELADWEHYVATPKKEALLAQVQLIAQSPLTDLAKQANQVKAFRANWNNLGHAEEDREQQLNEAFNLACEQAFEPCRTFFSEQEARRERHQAQRIVVIEKIEALAQTLNESIELKAIEKQYSQLKSEWQKSGEVDRKRYQPLLSRYRSACQPVNDFINQHHHSNAQEKQALVEQVQALLMLDNVFDATSQVKELQQQWKSIGFAGNKQDTKLWQQFRQLNDQLFEKRDQQKAAQSSEKAAQLAGLVAEFEALKQTASKASDLKSHQTLLQQFKQLKSKVPNKDGKQLINQISKSIEALEIEIEQFISAKKQRSWHLLFSAIEALIEQGSSAEVLSDEQFSTLSNKWLRILKEAQTSDIAADRNELTLKIEVLAGVESPSELNKERLAVQVSLMQEQMTSSQAVDLVSLFEQWLGLGQFNQADKAFLDRLRPIYC